jgi:hypothetical protein
LDTTTPSWFQVASRSGYSKIERTRVAIMGHDVFATRDAKLAMKWVLQRCHEASDNTAAMAALMPP